MDTAIEEEFSRIAQDAITEASQAECSLSDFKEGLRLMISELQERYDQVCDECRPK